ncbi:MAG: cupin domain-containing protein [Candidatus Latescibacterota bacterium]
MISHKVNLAEKLSCFTSHFDPKIVGEANGQHVKLVKFKGPFIWHHHDEEDEMFLVLRGSMDMHFRDGIVPVHQGEFIIVSRGTEHRPSAEKEVHVMLIEPASTRNTGNIKNSRTVDEPDTI